MPGIAGAGKQGGWPDQDLAVDASREVDPEEGERRIGNWIDKRFHEASTLWGQAQVAAEKRDDAGVCVGPGRCREAVRPCSAAEDRVCRVRETVRVQQA